MKNKVGKVILQFTFFNFQALKMGKEDRFIASISALDGAPKFIHNSFKLGTDSLSQTTGKKLTLDSLLLSKEKQKDFNKSYDSTIESKKKNDRLSGPEANSIEGKKLKRKGAYELNKEKVSDWDTTVQSRRLAKSYDFTNHKPSHTLETIGKCFPGIRFAFWIIVSNFNTFLFYRGEQQKIQN